MYKYTEAFNMGNDDRRFKTETLNPTGGIQYSRTSLVGFIL